jgi:5-methylcytosine-specific restriction endonuclease McrA
MSTKRNLNRKTKLRSLGLCTNCGKNKAIDGRVSCQECSLKSVARSVGDRSKWKELKNLYESQNGICSYFCIPITIGVDASIDHIIPKSKGGTDDISNLQWTHIWANKMKNDDDHNVFLEKLKEIIPKIADRFASAIP